MTAGAYCSKCGVPALSGHVCQKDDLIERHSIVAAEERPFAYCATCRFPQTCASNARCQLTEHGKRNPPPCGYCTTPITCAAEGCGHAANRGAYSHEPKPDLSRRVRIDADSSAVLQFAAYKRMGYTGAVAMPWPFELADGQRGEAGDYVLRDTSGKLALCRAKEFQQLWEPA